MQHFSNNYIFTEHRHAVSSTELMGAAQWNCADHSGLICRTVAWLLLGIRTYMFAFCVLLYYFRDEHYKVIKNRKFLAYGNFDFQIFVGFIMVCNRHSIYSTFMND